MPTFSKIDRSQGERHSGALSPNMRVCLLRLRELEDAAEDLARYMDRDGSGQLIDAPQTGELDEILNLPDARY